MSTLFQIAVIGLAGLFGILSCLGFFVMVKVFITAMRMRQSLGQLPHQFAARQAELNKAQGELVEMQRKLASDKAAFEKMAVEAAQTAKAKVSSIAEAVKREVEGEAAAAEHEAVALKDKVIARALTGLPATLGEK